MDDKENLNWLDKLISFFSPKRGAERIAYRQQEKALRDYDAGLYGNRTRDWRTTNKSAEDTDAPHRDVIRARARDMERNSDIFNSLLSAFMRNVSGKGMTLQSRIFEDDNTPNKELEGVLESEWNEWCKKQNCDVTGSQSFIAMMRMCLRRKKVDGGLILLKTFTGKGRIPFQLQAIEVDELAESQSAPKYDGNTVIGGIEYDSNKKAVGYWLQQYSINGIYEEPKFFPASRVIFYFTKNRPSQLREISDMTPSLLRIRDTNEFMDSIQVAKRVEAAFGVFIKRQNNTAATIGRGAPATDGKRTSYEDKHLSPGMIMEGNVGDEASVIDPKGRGADADAFIKTLLQLIASGQGLSYEAVSRDMSRSNYASARQGIIEDSMTFGEDLTELKEIMSEIYETFVISAVLAGVVIIKDFWENKRKYLKHEWVKPPKPWIDPSKESTANATALKSGQKTIKEIAAEQGEDWQDKIDGMIEVFEYLRQKGYTADFAGLQAINSNNQNTSDDKGDGDDEENDNG